MPRGAGALVVVVVGIILVAGCAGLDTPQRYAYDVSPAPIPDITQDTPSEPILAEPDAPRVFDREPDRVAERHGARLPESFTVTIHHAEIGPDATVLDEWTLTIRVDRPNHTRHLVLFAAGEATEHRFGTSWIHDEVWMTETETARRLITDNHTSIQANATPYTPVVTATPDRAAWARVAVELEPPREAERWVFHAFTFEITDVTVERPVTDPLMDGYRPNILYYHLEAVSADPTMLSREPIVTFPHNVTASAVVDGAGVIRGYEYRYTEARTVGRVTTTRSVTYSELGTTTTPPPDWLAAPPPRETSSHERTEHPGDTEQNKPPADRDLTHSITTALAS